MERSREAQHLAFEYQQFFNAGREPSDADVMLAGIANLLSELALSIIVSNILRDFDRKKGKRHGQGRLTAMRRIRRSGETLNHQHPTPRPAPGLAQRETPYARGAGESFFSLI